MKIFKRNPEKMTLDELSAAVSELTQERKQLNADIGKLQKIIGGKISFARIADGVENLTDAQKTALVQQIETTGIESAETFGEL